ncbi:unnamed protein product [Moneuplotes crassus]|uniref:C2 domain-containing protein n=1 Tax=Euplotes crassus TaxID=5936 RepID=A0AAD1X921_EUPCR|nr:unnamed protein product [Moneuplotes crassus]
MGSLLCRREASTFDYQIEEYAKINDDINKAVNLVMDDGHLSSKLLLRFKCQNLPNMDFMSLTDAFLVLYENKRGSNWEEVGRTEIIEDSLNPEFVTPIELVYYFEENQKFKIVAYDADEFENRRLDISKANYIGEAEFEIQKLISARHGVFETNFNDPNKAFNSALGLVVITYEEGRSAHNQVLEFNLTAENSDFSPGNGYFFIVGKKDIKNPLNFIPIMRSEILKYGDDNTWKLTSISLSSLVTGKKDNSSIDEITFQVSLYRHSKSGNHKLMGNFVSSIMEFIEDNSMITINGQKGEEFYISKSNTKLETVSSFLDYINAGLDMNLICGIDFTGSNGDPNMPKSLHYIYNPQNQYLAATLEVGKILLNFDNDKQVPMFGFGAVIPKYSTQVSHCFAMNGNIFRPEADNIAGIQECYKNILKSIRLSGPTYFAPMLSMWNDMVQFEYTKNKLKYYIFLILTDGVIHDIDETVDCIVQSSSLPVSIIIVGIGDANFDTMDFLDADDERLFSRKYQKFQERDNVQFVEFNKYKDNPHLLAQETLEELPRQMLDFYQKRGIKPSDLKMDYVDMEARDYFSAKGMEYSQKLSKLNYGTDIAQVMTQGIPFIDE